MSRTLAALGLENTNVAISDAMTYFQWLHSLQSARPVKRVFLPWPGQMRDAHWVVYHSRRLCYISSESFQEGNIVIWDLETGQRSILASIELRLSYMGLVSSDRYLAMITTLDNGNIIFVGIV